MTGTNGLFQAGAVGVTPLLVYSDADARAQSYFHNHPTVGYLSFPVPPGGLVTALVPYLLYRHGRNHSDPETLAAAYASGQALLIAFTWQTTLKAFTGRREPIGDPEEGVSERSRGFRLGFLRGGLFHGWPSGHAMTIAAMMTSLATYYPESSALRWGTLATTLYTAVGVTAVFGGQMHWLSDGVAGTLMGIAIGRAVGSYFRARVDGETPETGAPRATIAPLLAPGRTGVVISLRP